VFFWRYNVKTQRFTGPVQSCTINISPHFVNLHFMHNPPDILALAYKQTFMQDQLVLLQERQQQIPGSVHYTINRYTRQPQWNIEDTGMMVYHYGKSETEENFLELRFCVSGNVY